MSAFAGVGTARTRRAVPRPGKPEVMVVVVPLIKPFTTTRRADTQHPAQQ
jgi:hypothetical protein